MWCSWPSHCVTILRGYFLCDNFNVLLRHQTTRWCPTISCFVNSKKTHYYIATECYSTINHGHAACKPRGGSLKRLSRWSRSSHAPRGVRQWRGGRGAARGTAGTNDAQSLELSENRREKQPCYLVVDIEMMKRFDGSTWENPWTSILNISK